MKKKELKKRNRQMSRDMESLYNEYTNLCVGTQEILEAYDELKSTCSALEVGIAKLSIENATLKREVRNTTEQGKSIAIEKVDWKDDTTVVTWSDGTTTSVTRQKGEKYDRQSAIAYAIAKKVLGNTSIADVVKEYSEENQKDEKYARIYRALNSKSARNRIRAQKAWEQIPEKKRTSIKARVANASKENQ